MEREAEVRKSAVEEEVEERGVDYGGYVVGVTGLVNSSGLIIPHI